VVNITNWFNNIDNNYILIYLSKICLWFSIGIKLQLSISEGKYGLYLQNKIHIINKLTFLQLTLILFIIIHTTSIIMNILNNTMIEYYDINYFVGNINELYMTDNQNISNTNSNTNLNQSNSTSDGTIIAASLAVGSQLAKKAPTIGQKAFILASSTALGLGAIGVKNVVSNVTENLGKSSNKYLPFNPINNLDLSEILGLTGNSAFDLIIMINYFQTIQLFVSYFIVYNLFIYIIDFTFVFSKIIQMFPGPKGQKYILVITFQKLKN